MIKYRLVFALLLSLAVALSACAPRQVVKPIPADTQPARVLEMVRAKQDGLDGLRAMVKVSVLAKGGQRQGFDAVLYAKKPDSVRLTGLAFSSYTIFDMVIRGGKFYFYQPSEGYLYTGPAASLRGFLEGRGVKTDPSVLLRSLFLATPGEGDHYLVEAGPDGYSLMLAHDHDGLLAPVAKTEYDLGLNEKRRVFYDVLAKPYMTVVTPGYMDVDGYGLPASLEVMDSANGYTVDLTFEKYLVNPEGLDGDFTIEGGEFKGIRELE